MSYQQKQVFVGFVKKKDENENMVSADDNIKNKIKIPDKFTIF